MGQYISDEAQPVLFYCIPAANCKHTLFSSNIGFKVFHERPLPNLLTSVSIAIVLNLASQTRAKLLPRTVRLLNNLLLMSQKT